MGSQIPGDLWHLRPWRRGFLGPQRAATVAGLVSKDSMGKNMMEYIRDICIPIYHIHIYIYIQNVYLYIYIQMYRHIFTDIYIYVFADIYIYTYIGI